MPGKLPSLRVTHQNRAVIHPDPIAIATPDAVLDLCRLARARGMVVGLAYGLAIVWMDPRQERIETGREVVTPEPGQSREFRADVLERATGAWFQAVEGDR